MMRRERLRIQKSPDLEGGDFHGVWMCIYESLMKSWKKSYSWSFQILSATTHLVILFSFVYISHNNTYILVIFKVLITEQFLYFKMNGVKMSPRSVLFYGQIEK